MDRLLRPELFSTRYGLPRDALNKENLVDPILNCDTRLFVDPLLIPTSSNPVIRKTGDRLLRQRFEQIIKLVAISSRPGDKAWRTAAELLSLEERPETCLGYGGSGTSGRSRPEEMRQQVLRTIKEIIDLGEKDPSIVSLMGLFEKGIGPDTISDLATNILLPALCEITESFSKTYNIPTRVFPNSKYMNYSLPENPYKDERPVILVPKDIVRHLPLAADWSDIPKVVEEIEEIRESFNRYVGNIAEATIVERKEALRKAAFESLSNFRALMEALINSSSHYDPNTDIFNYYAFRRLLATNLSDFAGKIAAPQRQDIDELKRIVKDVIEQFRNLVENKNMWELLWDGDRPKRERAAQLLFYGVADMFCKANDVDISPEANMGGGPVDFKFSSGYKGRVLVEVKLSKGQVVHGYKKQLEIYKKAAETNVGILLVVDVGNLGNKLAKIKRLQGYRLSKGEPASDIEVVDGKRRLSASKN